ncbi:MAG TPA: ABC transporter substrate-binding protein [Hyphomicrobiaceae bacterium]|nr:ABC transporter substrate-binding protein [Hyphomicrobiaceae bacterium]
MKIAVFGERHALRCRCAWPPLRRFVLPACAGLTLLWTLGPAAAQTTPAAAAQPPLSIAVFVSSRNDQCYDNGIASAIEHLTKAEQGRINAAGGILRRRLDLQFLDDKLDDRRAIANMKDALANPNTVAMIGLSQTARGQAVFDALGPDIGASRIPFLSDITVNSVFEKYNNVFTMRPSHDDERVPAMAAFIKARNIERPAFIGLKDMLFSTSLGDGLKGSGAASFIADHRLALKDGKLDPADIAAVTADLKQKQPDLLVLAIGRSRTDDLLDSLEAAGVTPPLFITGRAENLVEDRGKEYPGDIFQLAWDNLPGIFSNRLRDRIARNGLGKWIFEGAKVPEAPGWKDGKCKTRPESPPDVFNERNMLAIGRGTQYADMVALVAEALAGADVTADTAALRGYLLNQLNTAYVAGRGAFRGSFENWSFRPKSRSADRTPFIVMRPNGLGASQLAPLQFLRLRTEKLRQIDTLYLDVDLIRTYRVEDNDKSFFADFYLSMRGNNASVKNIEFVNGFLDPKTNDRQVTIRTLHEAGPSDVYPSDMNIFLVSGKFTFEPRLADYPFDTQRFPIHIQPKSDAPAFIIQPPPHALRDKAVDTDGWTPRDQYVGFDEDFIPTLDAWTLRQSIVPFYSASFVWLMQRQTTDYYLRVVVPLAFILAVAYMSIFIPMNHFESIVTIQVTALLSAVALYLALPKVDAGDGTTISDRIFLFIYTSVSLMIVLSILRISQSANRSRWMAKSLGLAHIVFIPILVVLMMLYVYRASLGENANALWPQLSASALALLGR